MFTGLLRIEIIRPDGAVTRHVVRNTLTEAFRDFVAAKLAADTAETRTLTASDWDLVHNAVGAGTPPAIDAGDGSMAATVSFAGGEITATASVTYPDPFVDLRTRTFALDWDGSRFAYISGGDWEPEVASVQAGSTINFAWTITPELTNADQRQAYQAFIEPDFTLANTFALGTLVVGVMRGNTSPPTTLSASVWRWDGTADEFFNDETGPYPIEQVGSDVDSGQVALNGTVLTYTFAIPFWALQNGQPLSRDPIVVVHWGGNNLGLFGWARYATQTTGTEDLIFTITIP